MDKRKLWKTSIEIWTDYDPTGMELRDLGYEAERGDAYCTQCLVEEGADYTNLEGYEGFMGFFQMDDEDA